MGIKEIKKKLLQLNLPPKELFALELRLKKKLSSKKLSGLLNKHELECLAFMLGNAVSFPELIEEKLLRIRQKNEALKILAVKEPSKAHFKHALEVMGVSRKDAKEYNYKLRKTFYESHYLRTGTFNMETNKYWFEGWYHDIPYSFEWKTDREKKLGIIDSIIKILAPTSNRDAVIERLKDLKTRNLPGKESGGGKTYYDKK